jgi:predicted glycosyltransferase
VHGNHITYPGYQQLAYLHPARFTPDAEVVRSIGVDPTSRYYVVRFVSYQASHDLSTSGLSNEKKIELVRVLSEYGRVLVTSERALPAELEPYRLPLPAREMHHVLAFARLLVGESATMASEAAVLGVPAVYVSPQRRGFTDDQERRYGLVHNFTENRYHEDWMSTVTALASDESLGDRARAARSRLLEEKIDVTQWMVELFEREHEANFGKRDE